MICNPNEILVRNRLGADKQKRDHNHLQRGYETRSFLFQIVVVGMAILLAVVHSMPIVPTAMPGLEHPQIDPFSVNVTGSNLVACTLSKYLIDIVRL